MASGRFRAGVQPGDGVVARYGDVAVVVAPAGDAFTDALLRLISAEHHDPRSMLWHVVALVAAHQPGVPAFALAVGGPDARRVVVHGEARAVVGGEEVGGGAWTWTERAYDVTDTVALTVARDPVVVLPRSDLRDGVLAGAGLLLEPGLASPAAPRSEPTPAPQPAAAPAPPPPTVGQVRTSMRASLNETVHLADAIASLRADDGSRVPLDRDYVFGREPSRDPAVVRGSASPVKLDDDEQLVSRVHAYVRVAPDGVTVLDAGSANGTFIAAPGAGTWTRVGRDPIPVPVGHSVRFGLRVYTHVPAEEP